MITFHPMQPFRTAVLKPSALYFASDSQPSYAVVSAKELAMLLLNGSFQAATQPSLEALVPFGVFGEASAGQQQYALKGHNRNERALASPEMTQFFFERMSHQDLLHFATLWGHITQAALMSSSRLSGFYTQLEALFPEGVKIYKDPIE